MKKAALLSIVLLLALSCSDGSLLGRGRSRTKKNEDRRSKEASYVCLDLPIDLPACTFSVEAADRETHDKSSRNRRGLSGTLAELDGHDASSNFADNEAKSRAPIVVYKIEGCIPSRLPFDLPICKEEDSVGRTVEVKRLFPFNVMGLSGYNAGTTLVFPEVDVEQWHRFMHGPWSRPANVEDIVEKVDSAGRKNSRTELTIAKISKAPKPKKVDSSISTNDKKKKKTMLRKLKQFERRKPSEKVDESDVSRELPTVGKSQVSDDRRTVDSVSFPEPRANRNHRLGDRHQRNDRNIDQLAVEEASLARRADEAPRVKATLYDGEAIVREPTNARRDGTIEDEKFNDDAGQPDLPYSKVIAQYPEEANSIGAAGFPYNRDSQRERETPRSEAFDREPSSGQSSRKFLEGDNNDGSPYAKFPGFPDDRTKIEIGKVGSEFPYTRAIAYDPAKLRVASRGSEFPYAKAIPYDPKKLFDASSRGIVGFREAKVESKSSNSEVPFDSRMLDAAKEGRIFPYGKVAPEDTSRTVEETERPSDRDSGKIEMPARHAKIFRSEPSYARSRRIEKDQRRIEDTIHSREVRRNIINTGNDDYLYELQMQDRATRSAMEPEASGDASFDNDDAETPRRWSEFPYSKAIPFDPSKLRRPRSTVRDYVKTLIVAPKDFPYAEAIPYDPTKLVGFGRKKSEAQEGRIVDDESEMLGGLELSRLAGFVS